MPAEPTLLHDLLDRAATDPPAEKHAVDDVVRRAQRSRRVHRTLTTAGLVATVSAVAATGTLVAVGLHGRATPAPTGPVDTGIHGPVVHPDPATVVPEDRYTVTSRATEPALDDRNGRLYQEVTDDGQVLVSQPVWSDPDDALTERTRFGLVPAGSGTVEWLPAPPDAVYSTEMAPSGPSVVDVADGKVLWSDAGNRPRPTSTLLSVYDLTDRTWAQLTVDLKALGGGLGDGMAAPGTVRLGGGRIWFTSGGVRNGGGDSRTLYSVPVTGADTRVQGAELVVPREEAATVGDWDVDGSTLAYTDASNRPVDRLTVRDLGSGVARTFDPLSGDRCNQLGLDLAGDRVALTEYCGTRAKVRDDRVHVVGTDGSQVVTVQGDGVEGGSLGTDRLLVTARHDEAGAGTYVYTFADRTLARLAEGVSSYGAGGAGTGGSTVTWATPLPHGQTAWSATWR